MKTIGFVILTWNSEKVIESCLSSILNMNSKSLLPSIVVIDNGSNDSTMRLVQGAFEKHTDINTKLISLYRNTGTTYSRNLGILHMKESQVDYVCVLDSDTEINASAMEILVEVLDIYKDCGIVGPRMHDIKMVYQQSGRQIPTLTEKLFKVIPVKAIQEKGIKKQATISDTGVGCVDVGYLMSACWVMRTSLFDQIGLLDEKIFYAPEDVDYCIRCWENGLSVKYCYDAEILHEWQRLSRKKLISKHNIEHIKGLAYMFSKHKYVFNADRFMKDR